VAVREEGQVRAAAGVLRPRAFAVRTLLTLALIVLTSSAVHAYDYYVSPGFFELPLMKPLSGGARAVGMGGAGLAVVDDASAALMNPAGLTRLRRIELSGGLSRSASTIDGSAFGSDFGTDLTGTDLTALRVAYPFPTFRGSFVLALSGEQVYDFGTDFVVGYSDSFSGTEGLIVDQAEAFEADGGVMSWNLAAAIEASENVSLGVAVSYLSGTYDQRFVWVADDEDTPSEYDGSVRYESDATSDVSGFRATLGSLFYVNESVTCALVARTPVTLSFDGTIREEIEWYDGQTDQQVVVFEDEVTLPFSFSAGVAVTPPAGTAAADLVVLAADVTYTDWSETDYAGRVFLEEGGLLESRRTAYDEALDVNLGIEVIVPTWPLRLRAGYMSRPVAYQGLDIDSDRSYFTLGAGLLVDTIFSIDVAWLKGGYERSGPDFDYSEATDESAFIVEAAYRF
jgi:long-subunit fatty acid transport protein